MNKVNEFLDSFTDWADGEDNIQAVGLVGSYARGVAREDSDVDLMIIVKDLELYVSDNSWIEKFGETKEIKDEVWSQLKTKRVFYKNNLEVEFNFDKKSWANPKDSGTKRVVDDGIKILVDKEKILEDLMRGCENGIQIKEAALDDAQVIADIQSQTWLCAYPRPQLGIFKEDIKAKVDEFNQQGTERIIREMQKERAKTWVAKEDDKIVGFVGVLKGEKENIITALHILPEFQGEGIGTKLLQTALDWLGDLKKITIEVVNYNQQAIEFYEKFGFENTEEIVEDKIKLGQGKFIEKVLMVKLSSA